MRSLLESQVADLLSLRVKDSLSQVLGGILCEKHAQGACSNDIVRGTLSPLQSLIVRFESGIFTQLASLPPHLTTWCRLADAHNVRTPFSCGFLRSKVNVCGLCIEVNCLYINNRKIIKLREYSKRTIFSCIAAVSLRCYSSRLQDQPEPPFILFPCKTIDVSCTPIWHEQLILVV